MLGEFDFRMSQLLYLKAAMDQVPTFSPLLMMAAQMQAEYDAGVVVRSDYLSKKSVLSLA